jgi:hypothetical protein
MLGQVLKVVCLGRDIRGNLKLSRKAAMKPEEEVQTVPQPEDSTLAAETKTINAEDTQPPKPEKSSQSETVSKRKRGVS